MVCPVCGRSNYKGLCDDCRGGRSFISAVAPYKYKGSAKGMVMSLKYHDATHVARLMAQEMAEIWSGDVTLDVMTCVPSSEEAFIKRGFNQSYLIAEHLSKLLDIPFEELIGIEKRGRNQHFLTKEQRKAQKIDSFICTKNVSGKRVLLVDDVLTTGSTADACAKALVKRGAAGVYVLVFATVPYSTAIRQQTGKKKDS
jgi:ComF family protein